MVGGAGDAPSRWYSQSQDAGWDWGSFGVLLSDPGPAAVCSLQSAVVDTPPDSRSSKQVDCKHAQHLSTQWGKSQSALAGEGPALAVSPTPKQPPFPFFFKQPSPLLRRGCP